MAATIKVFFFGDSVCFGQGISLHKGWVTRLSARLDELAKEFGREILVVNSAVNGRTTRMALETMPFEIQSHAPDVVVVQFGMNDCNYWVSDRGHPRVSLKAFEANLEEIVRRALTFGARYVLLNTNHLTGRDKTAMPGTQLTYQESNRRYNEAIRTVAAALGERVILNDMERVFLQRSRSREALLPLVLPDLLHLSEAGHDLYYREIVGRIEDIIRTLSLS